MQQWAYIVIIFINSIPAPSVPYIGPYLNQLITIEVGMHTFVKDPPEHVNFSKLTRVSVPLGGHISCWLLIILCEDNNYE